MGRRPHPPGMQEAMGNPGRRKPKPQAPRKIELSPGEPPSWLRGKDYAKALDIWRRLAPTLVRLNVLTATDADSFARYCVHLSDWIRLSKVIREQGETQMVKTVSGDEMARLRPEFKAREIAERRVLELEDRFGLSPKHRLDLFGAMAAQGMGDLFAWRQQKDDEPPRDTPEPTDEHDDIIGYARGNAPRGAPLN